jgi:hypothetical protein
VIYFSRLDRILLDLSRQLARECPELVARFDIFERLAADEGPPPRELGARG